MIEIIKEAKMTADNDNQGRAALIDSICRLSWYVPRCVLDDLIEDVTQPSPEENSQSVVSSMPVNCGVTDSPRKKIDKKSAKAAAAAAAAPSTFLDPFSEDSDVDSVSKPASASFLDPFPYDSDGELGMRQSGQFHVGANKFPMVLPFASQHKCALLVITISGFTELPQLLDVESLSKVFKTYFEILVTEIMNRGGDILMIQGSTFVVEWPVFVEASLNEHSYKRDRQQKLCTTLEECTALAVSCALRVVTACSKFPVYMRTKGASSEIGSRTLIGELNATCGVAVGDVSAVHLGDNALRREFIIVGDPINELSELAGTNSAGEVAVTPGALVMLESFFDFSTSLRFNSSRTLAIIATHVECFFQLKDGKHVPFPSATQRELKEFLSVRSGIFDVTVLKHLRQLLSLYVHPVVEKVELTKPLIVKASMPDRFADSELRDIFTVSIMPILTSIDFNEGARMDIQSLQCLNKIFLLVNRELAYYGGQLKTISMNTDQKGFTMKANFGLRGSAFPNMISERALPCTIAIHNALRIELDIHSQLGGTLGKAFCGVVGGRLRHFYTILGPSIDLSETLMCVPSHPGILVDNSVRMKANKDYSFNSFYPAGHLDPRYNLGLMFEPLSAAEKRWGGPQGDFAGRTDEMSAIFRAAENVRNGSIKSKIILIQGESGTGKSALISQIIPSLTKKRVFVTRSICNDGDRMIPFSMFRSIFKHMLKERKRAAEKEKKGRRRSSGDSESASDSEIDGSLDDLVSLVKELDAPPEFVEIIAYHLLGINEKNGRNLTAVKADSLEEIVNFMALSIFRCTAHADLVIIVLDDVHFLDELSWKVIKALFLQGQKLLIVCASRPVKTYKLEVESAFWTTLNDVYSAEGRFSELHLAGLNENEVRDLISKRLEVPPSEIDNTFSTDIHVKSGGLPYFTSEILDSIKRNNLITKFSNGKLGWRADMSKDEMPDFNFATIRELTVFRLDSLEGSVIRILQICAVFGSEFKFSALVVVYRHLAEPERNKSEPTEVVKRALDVAVKEGILEEIYEGGRKEIDMASQGMKEKTISKHSDVIPSDGDSTNNLDSHVYYRFHHDMFRKTILELLLDTHKRRIHRFIAESLEEHTMGTIDETKDYYSMIELFLHWKASGETSKAASLALSVGDILIKMCMLNQAVKMFDEALQMWRYDSDDAEVDAEPVAGFSRKVLNSIYTDDLKHIVKLYVAKGKCCLSAANRPKESLEAYQSALSIMQLAPASADLKDRSITFPVFSGIFSLFKQGEIDQDKECTYEQEIVRLFVAETKLHGDPVHYSRALGMQAEVLARLGRVAEALEVMDDISKIYNVDEHSAAICKAYGSDRCAQVFSLSILWNLQLGNEEKALAMVDYVLNDLLPRMDILNVHNSFLMLWPIYSVLKERGEAARMRALLEDFLILPFREYLGQGSFTYFLPVYKPACMLLEICEAEEIEDLNEKVDWVLNDKGNVFSKVLDHAAGNFGKTCNQITAEICLCLAKRVDDLDTKCRLIAKGTALSRLTSKVCNGDYGAAKMTFAYERNQSIRAALELMVVEFNVTEEMLSNKAFQYD